MSSLSFSLRENLPLSHQLLGDEREEDSDSSAKEPPVKLFSQFLLSERTLTTCFQVVSEGAAASDTAVRLERIFLPSSVEREAADGVPYILRKVKIRNIDLQRKIFATNDIDSVLTAYS